MNTLDGSVPPCLSLLIGTSDHRDIRPDDVPILEERVGMLLDRFQQQYPSSPLAVLTSLAEGADRLTARVALSLGIDVHAVLPMPAAYYCSDFTEPMSADEFDFLLAHCKRVVVLPLIEGVTTEELASAHVRERQYIQASLYIARNSHIMLALWDGEDSPLQGGTYYAVHARLNSSIEVEGATIDPLDPPDVGILIHIWTPRPSSPPPDYPIGMVQYHIPAHSLPQEHYEQALSMLETYNTEVRLFYDQHCAAVEHAVGGALAELGGALPSFEHLYRQFTVADMLATFYQRRTVRTFIGMFASVFAAATAFDIYAHLHHWTGKVGLWAYIAIFGIVYAWYRVARKKRFQSKWLEYRALAESFRVQLFWYVAGIEQNAAEYYLRKQKTQLDWIRYALTAAAIESHPQPGKLETFSPIHRLEFVLKHWIQAEGTYFTRTLSRDTHRLRRLDLVIDLLFVASFIIAAIQLAVPTSYAILIRLGLMPVQAGLLVGYIEKMGFHGHIKSAHFMAALYTRAEEHIKCGFVRGDLNHITALIVELGKEALREIGEWILYHRERPLEIPKG